MKLRQNLNPRLVFAGLTGVFWFVWARFRFPQLENKRHLFLDPALICHVTCSAGAIFGFWTQVWLTPSAWGVSLKKWHRRVGYVSYVCSLGSVCFGGLRIYHIIVENKKQGVGPFAGGAIALVAVGLYQLVMTARSITSILRYQKLQRTMISLRKRPTEQQKLPGAGHPHDGLLVALERQSREHLRVHTDAGLQLLYGAALGPFWSRFWNVDDPVLGAPIVGRLLSGVLGGAGAGELPTLIKMLIMVLPQVLIPTFLVMRGHQDFGLAKDFSSSLSSREGKSRAKDE